MSHRVPLPRFGSASRSIRASACAIVLVALAACAGSPAVGPAETTSPSFAKGRPASTPVAVTIVDGGLGISSDGQGEYSDGVDGVGAVIDDVGNLIFGTGGSGRTMRFDFAAEVSGDLFTPPAPDGGVRFNTQVAGLLDMAVGATKCGGATVQYLTGSSRTTLGYHTFTGGAPYPESNNVIVTRTSTTTWTVAAAMAAECGGPDFVAGVKFEQDINVKPSRNIVVMNGYFVMPVQATIRVL